MGLVRSDFDCLLLGNTVLDHHNPETNNWVNWFHSVGVPIPKVISYARVSSGIQRKSGKGIQRQLEEANAWAQQNGLTLSAEEGFRDLVDEGKSASKGIHLKAGAGMGRILQAVRDGRLGDGDVLLVEDLSRLSRLEILDGLETVLLPLIRSGLVIVTLEDGQRLEQDALNSDAGALFNFVYKAQAAALYAAKLKRYGLKHREQNRKQILDGQPVCAGWAAEWLKLNGDHWEFSPYAATVKRLLEILWTEGSGRASQILNTEGHLSPKGLAWSQANVLRLIKNPAIWGARQIAAADYTSKEIAWRKARDKWVQAGRKGDPPVKPQRVYTVVPDTFPALLSKAEYDRLWAVIERRRKSPKEKGRRDQIRYIGQGQTRCICGALASVRAADTRGSKAIRREMRLAESRGDHKKAAELNEDLAESPRHCYLFCRGKELKTTDCTRMPIRIEPVTANLLVRLKGEHLKTLVGDSQSDVEHKATALRTLEQVLQNQLTGDEKQLRNAAEALKERVKTGRATAIFEDAWEEAKATAEATQQEIAEIRAELSSISGPNVTNTLDGLVKELLLTFYKGESTTDQRRAVNKLIQQLDIRITLDTGLQRVGMSVGDGAIDWQPLDDLAGQMALTGYTPGIRFTAHKINDQMIQQAIEAGEDPEVIEYMQQLKGIRQVAITNKPKP